MFDPITLDVMFGTTLGVGGNALMYFYRDGDMDTIPWPLTSEFRDDATLKAQLARALFDEIEMGRLADDTRSVLLPDGTLFTIATYVK